MGTRSTLTLILAVLSVGCASQAPESPADPIPVEITPYPYNADVTGADLPVEIGRFTVPADRLQSDSPGFVIGFVRYPAEDGVEGPPVVFLTSDDAPSLQRQTLYAELRQLGDVVVLHRRGVGFSSPPPPCSGRINYAFDKPLVPRDLTKLARRYADKCWSALAEAGVKPRYYSHEQVAGDLVDIPRALGAEAIFVVAENENILPAAIALERRPKRFTSAVFVNAYAEAELSDVFDRHLAAVCQAARRANCQQQLDELRKRLDRPSTIEIEVDPVKRLDISLDTAGIGLVAGRAWRSGKAAMLAFADIVAAASAGDDEPLARAILSARRDLGQPQLLAMLTHAGVWPAPGNAILADFEFGLTWPAGIASGARPELPGNFAIPLLRINGSAERGISRNANGSRTGIVVVNGDQSLLDAGSEVSRLLVQFLKGEEVSPVTIELSPRL